MIYCVNACNTRRDQSPDQGAEVPHCHVFEAYRCLGVDFVDVTVKVCSTPELDSQSVNNQKLLLFLSYFFIPLLQFSDREDRERHQ